MPRTKKAARQNRPRRTQEEWEEYKRQNPQRGDYKLAPKTNKNFETFYQGIGIVEEGDWETFNESLRKPLPITFRVTGYRSQAQELLKIIRGQYFSKLVGKEHGGHRLEPKCLPWYPGELAWQLDFTKKEIKQDETLERLHFFLTSETESGNISRQEAVSMLPPLLMDIKPHHKILDMCAAPGSKTAQLIELLHSDESVPTPDGLVVANDSNNKRCYLMTHQVKRIQSPNVMIINHDARILPNMFTSQGEEPELLKYDRILCDVPCSGDGTLRKNPDIWGRWNPNGAYNLHQLQKKILQRGLELLDVGGRLVYSTCSLNPIEDEAVILSAIQYGAGAIELVEVSDQLTGLNYNKGTYSWKVLTREGKWFESLEQADPGFAQAWPESIYPPLLPVAQDAHLERCVRVLPHQNDTGGFFMAVLQKVTELPHVTARNSRRDQKRQNEETFIEQIINRQEPAPGDKWIVHTSGMFKNKAKQKIIAECKLCNQSLHTGNEIQMHVGSRRHQKNLPKDTPEQPTQSVIDNTDAIPPPDTSISAPSPPVHKKSGPLVTVSITCPGFTDEPESKEKASEITDEPQSDGTTTAITDEPQSDGTTITNKPECEEKTSAITDNVESGEKTSETTESMESESATEAAGEVDGAQHDETNDTTVDNDIPPAKKAKLDTEEAGTGDSKEGGDLASHGDGSHGNGGVDGTEEGETRILVRLTGYREDPYYFCAPDEPVWPAIKAFYSISDDLRIEQMMFRNMKRVLYYVSKAIKNLVICNNERVKFINLGVKCFSDSPSPLVKDCDYRLCNEGLQVVQQHIGGRRVHMTRDDVITMLTQDNPFNYKLSEQAQADVYTIGPGSALFHFKPTESDPEPSVEIIFCGWRGKTSVRSFVNKDERSHYLRLCGVELADKQAEVQAKKASSQDDTEIEIVMGQDGTETPMGQASGDEEEVAQWTSGDTDPRRAEEEDRDNGEAAAS